MMPDGSIFGVWTFATQQHLVFVHASQKQRYVALHRRIDELASRLSMPVAPAFLLLTARALLGRRRGRCRVYTAVVR